MPSSSKIRKNSSFLSTSGHSRLPCDRDFTRIEKRRRRKDRVIKPSEWINEIKNTDISNPFQIAYVEHPLTDDLFNDGAPVIKVKDYKKDLICFYEASLLQENYYFKAITHYQSNLRSSRRVILKRKLNKIFLIIAGIIRLLSRKFATGISWNNYINRIATRKLAGIIRYFPEKTLTLTLFCCVLGKDTLRHFLLLGALLNYFSRDITVIFSN